MKVIKIKFVDFYTGFVPDNFLFYTLLSEMYDVVLSDTPDYVFFSVFGNEHLKYDCVKIFYTGENQSPDFNVCDYAIGFDYLQYGNRYLRLPCYYMNFAVFDLMRRKSDFSPDDLATKTGFCSFVYSNNYASPERKQIFDLLSAYKPVASGGRFLNNVGGAVRDKLAFQKSYKFAIAFENSSSPGYTTEKLIHAFASQTIPIYWGDPTVDKWFNTDSFINCHDFRSFEEVVERVKALDNDERAYLRMLQTPALCDMENDYAATVKNLKSFLTNIMEQPLEKAKRYNREYWGRKYINRQRELNKAYSRSLKGLSEALYMKCSRKIEQKKKSILFWRIHKILMKLAGKN